MNKLYTYIVIGLLILGVKSYAQDPIFTQYFLIPETQNPSFTGFLESTSAGVFHRSQWVSLNLKVDTDYAYFSTYSEEAQSGIGVNFLNHRESFTGYNYVQANVNYAYNVQLDYDWYFRPGIEVGFGSKSFGFQNLVLGDQINIGNETINPISIDPLQVKNRLNFLDISAGLLFHNNDFWIVTSVKHLNRPNISLVEEGNVPLDMFFSVTTGYEFDIASYIDPVFLPYETRMMLSANFMKQAQYNRLDIGTALIFNNLSLGTTFALNPMPQSTNSPFLSSINFFTGLQYEKFKIGLSYDAITSKIGKSGGTFELGLVYQFDLDARKCFGCPVNE